MGRYGMLNKFWKNPRYYYIILYQIGLKTWREGRVKSVHHLKRMCNEVDELGISRKVYYTWIITREISYSLGDHEILSISLEEREFHLMEPSEEKHFRILQYETQPKVAYSLKLFKRPWKQALNFSNTLRPTPNKQFFYSK